MVFSSLIFLFVFLPLVLGLYYLAPRAWRNGVALAASLLFFAWGAPLFVFPLIASSLLDYLLGRHLTPGAPARRRRRCVAIGIAVNVATLFYFKYANFAVDQVNAVLAAIGVARLHWTSVVMPIGISFFTFQKISYLVDVYRGTARPAARFGRYLLYVALFPQLIAGPIVRYHDVADQIDQRSYQLETFLDGVWRFGLGLAKKVLLANPLGRLADMAFDVPPGSLDAGGAWGGVYAYALQIFFDFSGYSDMAIGLGRMMGFQFLENFNFPYVATSITDFWRRWHISLGTWMREYLYIPLGGNRVAAGRRYLNLWLVFVFSGFWHGAAWNFVVWGAYHGSFLSLEKLLQRPDRRPRLPPLLKLPLTFLAVLIGWVFFRAPSLGHACAYLVAMSGGAAAEPSPAFIRDWQAAWGDSRNWAALATGTLAAFSPALRLAGLFHEWSVQDHQPWAPPRLVLRTAAALLLLLACAMPLITGGFNPFIYFRF